MACNSLQTYGIWAMCWGQGVCWPALTWLQGLCCWRCNENDSHPRTKISAEEWILAIVRDENWGTLSPIVIRLAACVLIVPTGGNRRTVYVNYRRASATIISDALASELFRRQSVKIPSRNRKMHNCDLCSLSSHKKSLDTLRYENNASP